MVISPEVVTRAIVAQYLAKVPSEHCKLCDLNEHQVSEEAIVGSPTLGSGIVSSFSTVLCYKLTDRHGLHSHG